MNSSSLKIPKSNCWNPRKNLPAKISQKTKERDFTLSFARAYIPKIKSLHSKTKKTAVKYTREIPINGYGIADFVAVYCNKTNDNSQSLVSKIDSSVIRTFELKISDWQRAMMRFFAAQEFQDNRSCFPSIIYSGGYIL